MKGDKEWILLLGLFMGLIWSEATGEPRYRCPSKKYIRLANSCYYLSGEIASWQEAHFRCRDMNSQLAVLATEYEDNSLRNYLEKRELAQLGRWIGGMWAHDRWIWAAQGIDIDSQRAFVSASIQNLPSSDTWMCLYMDSRNRYHWSNENCIRQLHYICEAPLTRNQNLTTTTLPPLIYSLSHQSGYDDPDHNNDDYNRNHIIGF